MYLCHSFCELGGTLLREALRDIHDFLVANPGEVLVIVNQDYVTPEDFVGAVRDAGLDKLAYRGPTSGRWPTLRQMIDSNQRVLFLAENQAGAAPWYHLAYERDRPGDAVLVQPAPAADRRRPGWPGPAGPTAAPRTRRCSSSTTGSPPTRCRSLARLAGQRLRAPDGRLRECQRIRHHLPNLVAVNFYRRGDLLRAVDTLNGIQ